MTKPDVSHYIAISVERELDKPALSLWFKTVRDNLPQGIITTTRIGDKTVQLVKSRDDGYRYVIPLTRDLTQSESEMMMGVIASVHSGDFDFLASRPDHTEVDTSVRVDHDPLIALCTDWAKVRHNDWVKGHQESGWRYGPVLSKSNRTHPLLRSWEELPDQYRSVDTKQLEEMLDLMKRSGYVLVHQEDLDKLLGSI